MLTLIMNLKVIELLLDDVIPRWLRYLSSCAKCKIIGYKNLSKCLLIMFLFIHSFLDKRGYTMTPQDGAYTSWSDWSLCSTTCGEGIMTRIRTCTNPPPMYGGSDCFATGSAFQQKPCTIKINCKGNFILITSNWVVLGCSYLRQGAGTRIKPSYYFCFTKI